MFACFACFFQMQLEIAPFLTKVSEMHNSYLKGQSILMLKFSWKILMDLNI